MDELLSGSLIQPLRPDGTSTIQEKIIFVGNNEIIKQINHIIDVSFPKIC